MKKYFEKIVSVIVPVYNTPIDLLKRCFDSIISQIYENIEIIVVNDGANKECEQYCNEYFENIYNSKVINQVNSGVSVARNTGILNSTGEYVAFVDSDDYISPNYIQDLIDVALTVDTDITFTSANKIYNNFCQKQFIYECKNKKFLLCYGDKVEFSPFNLDLIRYSMGKTI